MNDLNQGQLAGLKLYGDYLARGQVDDVNIGHVSQASLDRSAEYE